MATSFRFKKPLIPYLSKHTVYKYYSELCIYYPLNEIDEPIYYLGLHIDYVKSLEDLIDYVYITKDNVEVDKGNFVYSEINEICLVTDDTDISLYRAKPTNHYFNYKTQSFKKDISAEEKGDYVTIQSNLVEFIKILGYYEGQKFYIVNNNTNKLSYTTDIYKSMVYEDGVYYIEGESGYMYDMRNCFNINSIAQDILCYM